MLLIYHMSGRVSTVLLHFISVKKTYTNVVVITLTLCLNKWFVVQILKIGSKKLLTECQTDTQNLFCPKPYKTITKKYNAEKKRGKEAPNNPKVY